MIATFAHSSRRKSGASEKWNDTLQVIELVLAKLGLTPRCLVTARRSTCRLLAPISNNGRGVTWDRRRPAAEPEPGGAVCPPSSCGGIARWNRSPVSVECKQWGEGVPPKEVGWSQGSGGGPRESGLLLGKELLLGSGVLPGKWGCS